MRGILIILAQHPEIQRALEQLSQQVGPDQAERVLLRRDEPPVLKCPDIVDESLHRPVGRELPRIKAIRRSEARDRARQQMTKLNAKRRR